ncbi:AraC family transcriptional regulator [Algibacter amylolyticus]|uniref:AraC family transcriptional regulator n=1 Tax=Algibacter amylolyticus TaxID=1608400 RepID=A0A5M7B7C6_9FLAO|nr:AraC family transcriptional regulator [Algibacter amylolyticus]KAA5825222.1 AraC family transcriptional regulator [Algibacter amylolyticus]MBB5268656.1 AraC-like DNA-binding protein [Algibacter amylolyticus]TSJ77716.1 AraC family transcriptional regulator [Algibacter amylolyticus]
MKLHFLDRSNLNNSSFSTKVNEYPNFLKVWHYHPEIELVVVLKSQGTCFVGDGVEKFEENEIVLIGKNLPHMWLNDDAYFQENANLVAKAIAIHFDRKCLGATFFETPEMIHLSELFDRARFGIKFLNVDKKLIQDIQAMAESFGFDKTMAFLNILNKLAKHKKYKLLASQGYVNTLRNGENKTLDTIHAYIFNNFNKSISLEDVAKVANMNTSAFSRFFKRVNRKTFSRYLAEIRIGYACKLLLENKYNIAAVCYESGFHNISNFNRQFKLIMKKTPSAYLKEYKN